MIGGIYPGQTYPAQGYPGDQSAPVVVVSTAAVTTLEATLVRSVDGGASRTISETGAVRSSEDV